MTDTVARWLALVDGQWPASSAASWDVVGLQVGDPGWPVERVLVTLDVTPAVVEEAAEQPHTLVLAHHPLLFRPLDRLTPGTASGRIALQAATRGVAVAAAHTNLDVADDGAGTSDPVARVLDLQQLEPLSSRPGPARLRLVTFVPVEDAETVVDAMAAAGAGAIGDYSRCAFVVEGHGTFTAGPDADPAVGEPGERTDLAEARVEMELPTGRRDAVVAALLASHPYEQVAFDLQPLVVEPVPGIGRVGELASPLPLRALAARIRDDLPAPHLRFAGEPDRLVHRVAIVGGAGDSHIDDARRSGADVFVTGDLRHHVALDAVTMGLAVVDAGHHATESAAMPHWRRALAAAATRQGLTAPVIASDVDTCPWT